MTQPTLPVIRVLSPAPRAAWLDVARGDDAAFVTQTPAWTDAVCASGTYRDASRLYELADGRRFVLPLVRRRWLGAAGIEMSFPPAWGVGGLVGGEIDVEAIRSVLADLHDRRNLAVRIRPNPLHNQLWRDACTSAETLVSGRFHAVSLEGDVEAVWAQVSRSARRAVKKAEKAGVEVTCENAEQNMEILYDLTVKATALWAEHQNEPLALAKWRHRRRDPLSKLEAIAKHLGPACKLWVARLNGDPIGANLVLQDRNAHATRGALDPDRGRSTNAGYLLDWHGIRDAAEAGCNWYHLGESGESKTLANYKERFGARAYDHDHIRIEKLPLTSIDASARRLVKKVIGFRDT